MEPRELSPSLLEPLVTVVATLGELAATVSGPAGDVLLPAAPPRSLHVALGAFLGHLRDTLGHDGASSLGRALATLGATPGATWAHVSGAASAWRDSVAALGRAWARLAGEATELRDACGDAATAEATAVATAMATAEATAEATAAATGGKAGRWGPALGDLVAAGRWTELVTDKDEAAAALARHEARLAAAAAEAMAAFDARQESVVASGRAKAATIRARRAEAALAPLGRLVAACHEAAALPRELRRRLGDIEVALEAARRDGATPGGALVAAVAEAERLWEASARLATRHLLAALRELRGLLAGGHGGPGGRSVAERCQKAVEDIPGLLRGE